ncbi:MAG: hypothetical protein HYR73_05345 [Candidatus Eisenbacteria bacterium]|nr:hypothetical protein [Candidatus Eisenbacteria bacterium]
MPTRTRILTHDPATVARRALALLLVLSALAIALSAARAVQLVEAEAAAGLW